MNLGMGLALGTTMGNPALGLALGAALPDAYGTSSSIYGQGSGRRRAPEPPETPAERKARLTRVREQAAWEAIRNDAFQTWLKDPKNAARYKAARDADAEELAEINRVQVAEREARIAKRNLEQAAYDMKVRSIYRKRAWAISAVLIANAVVAAVGVGEGQPLLGFILAGILIWTGVWGVRHYLPYGERPDEGDSYMDAYGDLYLTSRFDYESFGNGEAVKMREAAILEIIGR